MNSDQPPPYGPAPPVGPPAPGFPPGYSSQPAGFPGQPFQGYPGQGSYTPYQFYQGPPGPYGVQPGYQTGPMGPQYGEPSKNPVYLVQDGSHGDGRRVGGVSGMEACLGACWTALCCCCLWDMFT